ncbi:sugar ABC transporter ATP-binding protein [Acidisoma sp. S159]|uniref:sugar ABC transporter ATP-binding protein n=1 Tax=Acidisoma sp. S159 TaxID=1747225 RepID=UPI00131E2AAD|nr:sugar ABC transporter ATP-binding protein [Acidisoma sp. S159]
MARQNIGQPAERGPDTPVAEAIRVSKQFGANRVLRDVSLNLASTESRALVGRNGAGKSTLVSILTGLVSPDSGRVRLGGNDAPKLADRAGWRSGVACVYQRSTVVPGLTVAENLMLNMQPSIVGNWLSWSATNRAARRALEDWGLEIDVEVEASRLNVEQRQVVEIARALLQGTRFIILDEPTAELEGREVARLFERIVRLQKSGVAFLYISHHLEEIYEICNSVTVLRDGAVVADAPISEMSRDDVIISMVGRSMVAQANTVRIRDGKRGCEGPVEPAVLEVQNLTIAGAAEEVSFDLVKGECVGLTGLASSGKEEVADAIAGLTKLRSGKILIDGEVIGSGGVISARDKGVGYVPRDRHARGILPQMALSENLTITVQQKLGSWGLVSRKRRDRLARSIIDAFGVVSSSCEQPIGELSGGNQQKAITGRALASDPKVLVLSHPTQGVDIASKAALFEIVEGVRAKGTAILVVTDDLDELVICDRVLTMFRGRIVAEFGAERQNTQIVAAMEGLGGNE